MVEAPLQYVLSAREYELLRRFISDKTSDGSRGRKSDSSLLRAPSTSHDFNASAFRSAFRLYLATKYGLTAWELISSRLFRRKAAADTVTKKALLSASTKLALAGSSFLFFYRVLYGFLTRLRLRLLHEKAKKIRQRYPKVFAALTSNLAPAIGASLAGLTLGIAPSDQLRITVAIFAASRSLEILYNSLDAHGYLKSKPRWMGSWMINVLSQGQLLHAFVFDHDCFPQAYWSFILSHTPEYVQRRPAELSTKVTWPSPEQIVAALGQMATLKWPLFVSPTLHPNNKQPLPPSINPIISPITSRAHPILQNLSCALIHPSEQSCFTTYLRQNLKDFPKMARFFALYYGAFSVLRYKQLIKDPVGFVNKLSAQILRTTVALTGAISASWGSICLFQNLLPRSFLPRFRFFLGGMLGGLFSILDRTSSGHANNLYAARTSVDTLWKVGVKHGWWKGVRGGDVLLFTAAWALMGIICQSERDSIVDKARGRLIMRLVMGEADIGLKNKPDDSAATGEKEIRGKQA